LKSVKITKAETCGGGAERLVADCRQVIDAIFDPERLSLTPYQFVSNPRPSLGVEIELNLVDSRTMALRSGAAQILSEVPPELESSIKPELLQCYIELNTKVCEDVAEVEADLASNLQVVREIARRHDLRIFWGATHPFSPWQDQVVTPNERYHGLIQLLQETARRLVTFGLHVHVGVDSGDKAIMICDRILQHLPILLALSVNSPFWQGRNTGLHSQRSKIMETLPTAGLPPLMRNWSEYIWLLNNMIETGFITTIREIWWDVRPHHNFGTVEVRICDMPPSLEDVLGLTALIQCLVYDLSEEIDRGTYQFDCHPFLIRQNKWRACRYGMDAKLVDAATHQAIEARRVVHNLVDRLRFRAEELDCTRYLEIVSLMADRPTGSVRQLTAFDETHNLAEVVRRMLAQQA
jgi:glutamate---cysteine ligase / carboxylate-amine ligase